MLNKVLTLTDGTYTLPELDTDIPQGDVPGGNIKIFDTHIAKAKIVFPLLVKELAELAEADRPDKRAVFAAINTIAANYESIALLLEEPLTMEDVAQRLTSVKAGYLCEGGKLTPVWRIEAGGHKESLYFDLYTAEKYGLD